ncbi:VWA domain-containing protein [Paucisalibacillus sp. EB02]|uniref:vWA domain-containing protein n=1 Tax=Paucisalibacillus sp. EB02 TaxID=1347087 RepID=UPI0004B1C271|nr:VWA domain-containing protein [Paucisalibacillus sp. EB02]
MRNYLLILMIGLLFVTAACSQDNQTIVEEPVDDEEQVRDKNHQKSEVETMKVEIGEIGTTESLDNIKNQPVGILVNDLTLDKELSTDTEEVLDSLNEELHNQLVKIINETKDPKVIEGALIKLLGSPNYKEAIENAEAFQPEFEVPYLPNPKRVSESGNSEEIGKAIILLDASSSMLLSVDGEVKMDVAKDAVMRFADVIGQESEVSLVVYGHKGSEANSDKKLSCEGIEEIYPMGAYNSESFQESLSNFESKGWTPLAGAINKATEMSAEIEGTITVYIVSDGVETCDGNPIIAAEDFVKENEDRSVNIIGFNVDKKAEEQLTAVSASGNGKYYSANNAEEIQETIEYEWLPSMGELAWAHMKAPGPWEILAEYNRYREEHKTIRQLIDKEKERIDAAMNIIITKEMVSLDTYKEIEEIISSRYSSKIEIYRELESQKIEEIDKIADEIKDRVYQWIEEMEELVYE